MTVSHNYQEQPRRFRARTKALHYRKQRDTEKPNTTNTNYNTQDMVQRVLQLATEESDDPDLRDRGFVYWRLLSTNPEAAKAVVLSEKPNIADDTFTLEPAVLDMLIGQVGGEGKLLYLSRTSFFVSSTVLGVQVSLCPIAFYLFTIVWIYVRAYW